MSTACTNSFYVNHTFRVARLLAVALATVAVSGWVVGQEGDPAPAKTRAAAKGYLPPFYRDVIDGVQRDKIYKIQERYTAEITALEEQVKALRAKRDGEIESLLTPEQKKRLGELKTEAEQKRAADQKARVSQTKNASSEKAAPPAQEPTKP